MNELTERHVQAVWYDVSLRPRELVSSGGEAVRVVSPGEWNGGAGPDFTGAVLELGEARRVMTGDVEVHICPADWDLHGHGADPNYRNVIAHVTWREGPSPESLPRGAVSIYLGRCMDPGFTPERIDLPAYPYLKYPVSSRPCEKRYSGDQAYAGRLLCSIGRHRIKMKARRLTGRLLERTAAGGADGDAVRRQLFYEELLAALGYSANVAGFRRLAERVPLASLPADGETVEAALVSAAQFERFDRHGSRPANSPEKRLALAARLISSPAVMALRQSTDFSREACGRMVELLSASRSLGRRRAAAIVTNVILPFAVAEGRAAIPDDYLPPEDVSLPVRIAAMRLLGRDHNPAIYLRNGLALQGLIHVYKHYCGVYYPKCEDCALAG